MHRGVSAGDNHGSLQCITLSYRGIHFALLSTLTRVNLSLLTRLIVWFYKSHYICHRSGAGGPLQYWRKYYIVNIYCRYIFGLIDWLVRSVLHNYIYTHI